MSSFISAHVITCMTRQDLERLLKRLAREGSQGGVNLVRARCDTLSGRMVCEWDAPGQEALVEWLAQHNVRFRSAEEWCFRVQLEARDGRMTSVQP